MAKKSSKQAMETLSGKVPIELYRQFETYRDENGDLSKSEALRQLLSKALMETQVLKEATHLVDCQHQITREESRRFTALILNNMAAEQPMSRETIPDLIRQTIQIAQERVHEGD